MDDMGIFRTTIEIASFGAAERKTALHGVMVDTGSEYSWIPAGVLRALGIAPERVDRFETADKRILERPVGYMLVFAGGRAAPTAVAFAQPGDLIRLGAHALDGMNLAVDSARCELVPGGPVPVAAVAA